MQKVSKETTGDNKDVGLLVAIDSDGCAFDTMEIKHKECFIPNFIDSWDLQPISRLARETWEFVNLYSAWRGVNRFPALVRTFDLLADRAEVKRRGYVTPNIEGLRLWIDNETKLSNQSLEQAILEKKKTAKRCDDDEIRVLEKASAWSRAVNRDIERIVRNAPPFLYVRESLKLIRSVAETIVISSTPSEALAREWNEHGIDKYVVAIEGQEQGSKAERLRAAIESGHDKDRVLMVGDAIGDLNAARACGAHFYPIVRGDEERSWERFYFEAFATFMSGSYSGFYEDLLVEEFLTRLPSVPPWETVSNT